MNGCWGETQKSTRGWVFSEAGIGCDCFGESLRLHICEDSAPAVQIVPSISESDRYLVESVPHGLHNKRSSLLNHTVHRRPRHGTAIVVVLKGYLRVLRRRHLVNDEHDGRHTSWLDDSHLLMIGIDAKLI